MKRRLIKMLWLLSACAWVAGFGPAAMTAPAQDRLTNYPGYAQYHKMSEAERSPTYVSGEVSVDWARDGKGFYYQCNSNWIHYDVETRKFTTNSLNDPSLPPGLMASGQKNRDGTVIGGGGSLGGGGIMRNLMEITTSPDRRWTAFARDNNLWIGDPAGSNSFAVTTEGNATNRIRFGVSTIVYGEELGMGVGMWWSPDNRKLAFYRFDETKVPDYTILTEQSRQYDHTQVDPYPNAGMPSPVVDLFVYDLETRKSTPLDVRAGQPFGDDVVGYYVYRLAWTPDGKELLFSRMNRRQNTLELAASDPDTGKTRVIVREEHLTNWVDWAPHFEYLPDRQRFIWTSERNGFKNFYLYDLSGKLLATLTDHPFDVADLLKIDEAAGVIYYMARDGDNYLKLQLHRVGMDGRNDVRLTDPAFNHTVEFTSYTNYLTDVLQTHDSPPETHLLDKDGKVVAVLARSDLAKFEELGLRKIELFTFKAADGQTELHGILQFPSNFDPAKKYPLLVNVYGGPNTSGARETFGNPSLLTEFGFLVASFDSRSLAGRGRKFSDPFYHHLGIVEVDDQAAGVKALEERPYVDKDRVGVYGTSYGGTTAALLLMRYPDLFKAASVSSPVTDYQNYNDIYSERYLGLLSDNKRGYQLAAVTTYVGRLKGILLLYYGTADTNVHNSNSLQLIKLLQAAGKSFDLQVGPDQGHTAVNQARMMEFFIENLVMK